MTQRVSVTVNIGANAPIEVIRQTIDDLDRVCQFGGTLEYRSGLAAAEAAVLQQPSEWLQQPSEWLPQFPSVSGPFMVVPAPFEPSVRFPMRAAVTTAVSRYLEQSNVSSESITTVESIQYSNPFISIMAISAIGLLVLQTVQTVRDWGPTVRVKTAAAEDYENVVYNRKRLRDKLVDKFVETDTPVSAALTDDLLTHDVARSMIALGNSEFTMKELGPAEGKSKTKTKSKTKSRDEDTDDDVDED